MKRIKRVIGLLLCLLLLWCTAAAQTENPTNADKVDLLEETIQFPFLAETNELAVNIRAEASTKSAKVGRLERGTQLLVVGAEVDRNGDLFYRVQLEDDKVGYIRSDLLMATEFVEAQQEANPASASNEIQLIGNRKTKKYHEPGCNSLPAEKNRVYFASADAAEEQGYIHCKNCD